MTAFEAIDAPESPSPTERALGAVGRREELIPASRAYCREAAREYGLDVAFSRLDWEVSTRAKRRAAAVKRPKIPDAEIGDPLDWASLAGDWADGTDPRRCTVSLTWAAYEAFDRAEWAATLRHELIHVEQFQRFGTTDHGAAFRERAEAVDAAVRCRPFADPKYVLRCSACGTVVGRRYRECAIVREPERYRSSCCEASVECSRSRDGE
ncbi:SprT-like domain-containing protein [Halorussus marinus]|uniref:SprT-like domain-containing protein n=1 Tax=Halorussus marinus TaxID=2505976 RepID=UPI00106EA25B|nr:SprT-like domain-containing protein [Halorussus marinus]